jgi:DNA-directed RNA polymerase specialized sigma24 family protein
MYSNKDGIRYSEFKLADIKFEDIRPFLHKLPAKEIDLLTLYLEKRKNQKDIARIFSVTQGAVSSRLKRSLARLAFIRDLPKITDEDIELSLKSIFDPVEIEIIKLMKQTTCQSKTAMMVNERFSLVEEKRRMTQVKVRHRFEKCLMELEKRQKDVNYRRFYDLLVMIKKNLYMLHEVILPHFSRGSHAIFSLDS